VNLEYLCKYRLFMARQKDPLHLYYSYALQKSKSLYSLGGSVNIFGKPLLAFEYFCFIVLIKKFKTVYIS